VSTFFSVLIINLFSNYITPSLLICQTENARSLHFFTEKPGKNAEKWSTGTENSRKTGALSDRWNTIRHLFGLKSSGRFSSWELSRDVRLSAVSRAVSPAAASQPVSAANGANCAALSSTV